MTVLRRLLARSLDNWHRDGFRRDPHPFLLAHDDYMDCLGRLRVPAAPVRRSSPSALMSLLLALCGCAALGRAADAGIARVDAADLAAKVRERVTTERVEAVLEWVRRPGGDAGRSEEKP